MNLAPNGKVSNLTAEQYKLVRTTAFKNWFGDWENSPETASKVVDENGEPLVVYHGTSKDLFYEFMPYAVEYVNGESIKEFRGNKTDQEFDDYINQYGLRKIEPRFYFSVRHIWGDKKLQCFLDIKNLYVTDEYTPKISKEYDGFRVPNQDGNDYYCVFQSNQIKLADGTNTTFDGGNPDIRFDGGGGINSVKVYHGTTRDFKNFDTKKLGEATKSGSAKNGFWFTDDIATAKSYARAENERKVQEFLDRGDRELALKLENLIFANKDNKYLKEIILTYKNPLIIDADGSMYNDFSDEIMTATQKAKNKGNDILIVKNLSDNADYSEYTPATHYLVLDNSIIKSSNSDIRFDKGGLTNKYVSYKDKYNKKYGYSNGESHDLQEIAKDTGVSMKGLQQIYNKGIGAYKTNPQSVRPNVKSKEQWAMARVYSAVMGGKASKVDANELSKGKMETGGLILQNLKKHLEEFSNKEFYEGTKYSDISISCDLSKGNCYDISEELYDFLKQKGYKDLSLVEVKKPKFDLTDAHYEWKPSITEYSSLFHIILKVNNYFIDFTGIQYSKEDIGLKIYTEKQLKKRWGKISYFNKYKTGGTTKSFTYTIGGL